MLRGSASGVIRPPPRRATSHLPYWPRCQASAQMAPRTWLPMRLQLCPYRCSLSGCSLLCCVPDGAHPAETRVPLITIIMGDLRKQQFAALPPPRHVSELKQQTCGPGEHQYLSLSHTQPRTKEFNSATPQPPVTAAHHLLSQYNPLPRSSSHSENCPCLPVCPWNCLRSQNCCSP